MGNDKYVDEKQKFIEENIGKDNLLMRPCTKDVVEVVTMHFDHEEAKGTIAIERCGYGSYIWVNGKCIAMVDLFHCSDEESEENGGGPYFQIVMYDREGDNATAAFKFKKDKSEFVPDDRTEPLWTFKEEVPAWYINADDRPVYTVPSDAMGCRGPYSETEVSELTGTDYSYLKDAIQGKPVFTPDYPEARYKN